MTVYMEDKLDLQEPQPDPQPDQPVVRRRLTATEARRKYGIRSVILIALLFWFGYDGWHNPKFQKPEKKFDMWFNRVGAYAIGIGLLYSGAMFGSASMTVKRQQESGQVEEDSSPDQQ